MQIHMTSKKLLYQLDMLVQLCVGPEDAALPVNGDRPDGVCIGVLVVVTWW